MEPRWCVRDAHGVLHFAFKDQNWKPYPECWRFNAPGVDGEQYKHVTDVRPTCLWCARLRPFE